MATSDVFDGNHVGLYVLDPESGQVLIDVNSQKYFTPASNTKILTLYTALNLLGDSIPALQYQQWGDTLIFWGTGDPTFLHPDFKESRKTYDKLKNSSATHLIFSTSNFSDPPYGEGWSWDDYNYSYQIEKSPLPIYGNITTIQKKRDTVELFINPPIMALYLDPDENRKNFQREVSSNVIRGPYLEDSMAYVRKIPFKTDPDFIAYLLSDTLDREVDIADIGTDTTRETHLMLSIPVDSLYRPMMQRSDNFFAEQILLMCARQVSDTLSAEIAIDYALQNLFQDLPDQPKWVDGSGLSRYNLFTPRSVVAIWRKMSELIPKERLFHLLAAGGESGTLRNWYAEDPPFVYGKTGTLSNNHCLSGFLIADSGKTLLFSFMQNNYPTSSAVIKEEMELILRLIKEKY